MVLRLDNVFLGRGIQVTLSVSKIVLSCQGLVTFSVETVFIISVVVRFGIIV